MNDESDVYLACVDYLQTTGWTLLSGEPPGGSVHLPRVEIHPPSSQTRGSTGSKKPDLIAYKDGFIILVELKYRFDSSDIEKLDTIVDGSDWRDSLLRSFEERSLFERFELNSSLKSTIKSGDALQKVVGLGEVGADFPDDYIGLIFGSDGSPRIIYGNSAKVPLEDIQSI